MSYYYTQDPPSELLLSVSIKKTSIFLSAGRRQRDGGLHEQNQLNVQRRVWIGKLE